MLFFASAVQNASTMRDTLSLMPRTSGLSTQRHIAFSGARKPIVPWKTGFGGAAGGAAGSAAGVADLPPLPDLPDLAGVAASSPFVELLSAKASASRGPFDPLPLPPSFFVLLPFFFGAS